MFDVQIVFMCKTLESQLVFQELVDFCAKLSGFLLYTIQCLQQLAYQIRTIRILLACGNLLVDVFLQVCVQECSQLIHLIQLVVQNVLNEPNDGCGGLSSLSSSAEQYFIIQPTIESHLLLVEAMQNTSNTNTRSAGEM